MKVAFITSEAVPFSKTGGLGDVTGVLPSALAKLVRRRLRAAGAIARVGPDDFFVADDRPDEALDLVLTARVG